MPEDEVCVECWPDTTFTANGIVRKSWPFGKGRELFGNGLKYLYKLIENHVETKIFKSNIFVIGKVLPKFMKILYLEVWSHTVIVIMHYRYNVLLFCQSFV